MERAVYSDKKVLLITNDLGPRAGGIETFVLGLVEGLPKNTLTIFTSSQKGDRAFDAQLLEKFGAVVIRDRSKMLFPNFIPNTSMSFTLAKLHMQSIIKTINQHTN